VASIFRKKLWENESGHALIGHMASAMAPMYWANSFYVLLSNWYVRSTRIAIVLLCWDWYLESHLSGEEYCKR